MIVWSFITLLRWCLWLYLLLPRVPNSVGCAIWAILVTLKKYSLYPLLYHLHVLEVCFGGHTKAIVKIRSLRSDIYTIFNWPITTLVQDTHQLSHSDTILVHHIPPSLLGRQRQCEIRSFPHISTHDQWWESNAKPFWSADHHPIHRLGHMLPHTSGRLYN